MDQNRPDVNNTNHQQNVHLHMHHVCACQGLYPPTYYPPISYRTPLIPYAAPQTVARPYLQHYQYTQFNVGSQYNMPITPIPSSYTPHQSESSAVALPAARRDRDEPLETSDRTPPEPPADFDFSPVIPPVSELFCVNILKNF